MPTSILPVRAATLAAVLVVAFALPAIADDTLRKSEQPDLAAVRARIKAKEYAPARDQLFRILDTNQHADVYNLLGFTLRKTGDHANALRYYQMALDREPEHKGAHEYLGELYVETKQPDKAKAHLAILVRLCPAGCEEREDLEKAMREVGIAIPAKP